MSEIDLLFDILCEHESKFARSFSLIPSENMISPLARLAFLSDGFSRYFFDEKEVFGRWSFEGGSIIGEIQRSIAVPLLRRLGRAAHVNIHAVSGLTGMLLAISAFGGAAGQTFLSVPVECGGHPDTAYVAGKLGLAAHKIPFSDWATIDLAALADTMARIAPRLVYIDHATHLFPLDLRQVIAAIRAGATAPVHVHVDTSHVNGLIWGDQLPNPLACGADSYGGSTHKTFPGPHKAVIFTNDAEVAEQLTLSAVNLVSHHHTASVVALAIGLLEFAECGGARYAASVISNARTFARRLSARGLEVQGRNGCHTANHQVWTASPPGLAAHDAASRLFRSGIVVNPYNPIPSLNAAGIRMGLNEPTRLGLEAGDVERLADLIADLLVAGRDGDAVGRDVAELRSGFKPRFCFADDVVAQKWQSLSAQFNDARSLGLEVRT